MLAIGFTYDVIQRAYSKNLQRMECKLYLTIINYTRYHINVLLKLSRVLYPIWEADEEVRTQVNNISQNLNHNLNILK